ncbi:M48 family metallopeptidase [Chroococcus sp. FPU101]|uniref:M48 family metallopeptidase n=1 Tax=Chroococcus sp. FPU101 TaxID=1974212 RepID=UPI001A8FEC67|nr:M48 family metallopeptidase [Chroococcus sp. FPU101]GFE68605.1 peptidase M48 Ste24p [Chroococcus sp. FPU101]
MPSYPGISSQAFKHPLDQQAEQALRSVPGFDLLATRFSEYIYERPQQIYLMGNNLKVGPRQYSTLYGIYRECLQALDISPEPTLYVSQEPFVNAYSLGREHPYIVINTGLLDLLEENELRTVIAHELGHLKCDHSILIQMFLWVRNTATFLGDLTLGIGKIMTTGLIYAFYEWRRKAELSSDRASLLVLDDVTPIYKTMMKLAGGSQKYVHECSLSEFLKQSDDYYRMDEDSLNQFYKVLIYNGANDTFLAHPFTVERVRYIQEWSTSTQYSQIRQGNYPKVRKEGSINVNATPQKQESEDLKKKIADLQAEIDRIKSQKDT